MYEFCWMELNHISKFQIHRLLSVVNSWYDIIWLQIMEKFIHIHYVSMASGKKQKTKNTDGNKIDTRKMFCEIINVIIDQISFSYGKICELWYILFIESNEIQSQSLFILEIINNIIQNTFTLCECANVHGEDTIFKRYPILHKSYRFNFWFINTKHILHKHIGKF